MTSLIRWNPGRNLEPFSRDPFFRRFFDLLDESRGEDQVWYPALDVVEQQDKLVVHAELPGIDPQQVEVNLQGDTLTIRGERKFEQEKKDEGKYLRREHVYGSFQRTLQLPCHVNADKVKASCKNGVMTITLPKAEEHIGRQIPVETK